MAPRRAAFAAGALATWCLLLVTAGAAPTKDGYLVPLASNDAWDYYEFNLTGKWVTTSVTPFNSSRGAKDATAVGTVITVIAQMFNSKGEVVGIWQAVRTTVGDSFNVPGSKGTRVLNILLTVMAEFGKPETGYFDDALAINIIAKRPGSQKDSTAFPDYDAVISGGTGRFLGATGTGDIQPQLFNRREDTVIQSILGFKVWVPRNLPTPKGPISGRRRTL